MGIDGFIIVLGRKDSEVMVKFHAMSTQIQKAAPRAMKTK